jgi:pathogenesis-related protein 1
MLGKGRRIIFSCGWRLIVMKLLLLFISTLLMNSLFSQDLSKGTGSSISMEQAKAALDFHNKVRNDVGVPPLEWSAELSAFAQEWADQLKEQGCKPKHRPHSGQWKQQHGENIFWGSNNSFTALYASEGWYSEIKDYIHGPLRSETWAKAGHYTQMIWRSTTKVGFGIAQCSNGGIIIVANYNPAGNFMGEKAY